MATFEFTSPEGKVYQVNGPDGATTQQAFEVLQQHLSSSNSGAGGRASEAAPITTNNRDVAGGIVKARAAGYTDDEISDHLADTLPGIRKARDAGYSNAEILAHLAGTTPSSATAGSSDSTLSDVGKSLASGAVRGIVDTATAIPSLAARAKTAANKYLFDPVFNAISGPPKADAGAQQAPDVNAAVQQGADAIKGQLHTPTTTAGRYAQTIGYFAPNVIGGPETLANRLLTRMVAPGVASEAAGQATAGTAAEPYARMAGAVIGGAGASAALARARAQALLARPTVDDVKDAASASYNAPEVKNLRVTPQSVNNLGADIAQSLDQRGFFPEDHSGVFNAVNRLSNASGPVSFDDLDAVRKALRGHAGSIDSFGRPTPTAAAANHAISHIDDYMANGMTDPRNVLQGNPVAARVFINNARQNSGAAIRSEQVLNKLDNSQIDAAAANSGENVANRVRQGLKTFIKNDGAKMGGYTDAEQAQMQRLVRGSLAMNTLRHAGNALGGGGGLGSLVSRGLGYGLAGPIGAFAPEVGHALKHIANYATVRQANNLATTLLSRAPLVQRVLTANRAIRAANAAATRSAATNGALRALIVSRLLNGGNGNGTSN